MTTAVQVEKKTISVIIIEDFKLMLMTFKILFIPSSTEGISADQTTAKKENND